MSDNDRFHVCVTCGRLKHEDLFKKGECTCDDCHEEDRHAVNWHKADDGNGFVSNESPRNSQSRETGTDRSANTDESDGGGDA